MRRIAAILAGLALAGGAAPASAAETAPTGQAGPPAPEVAAVVFNPYDLHEDLVADLLARIAPDDGSGHLRLTEPFLAEADFAGCSGRGVEPTVGVREPRAARDAPRAEGPPTVVVVISPAPGFLVGWNCVGVGRGPSDAARQGPGVAWSPGAEDSNARAAAGCLLAAAAESGW